MALLEQKQEQFVIGFKTLIANKRFKEKFIKIGLQLESSIIIIAGNGRISKDSKSITTVTQKEWTIQNV